MGEYAFGKMGQQRAEEARALSEKWAEDHEQAIEDASDRSNDDLERIYGPVKKLARHLVDDAERNDAMHRVKLQNAQGLLESGERVELVQALRTKVEESPWFLWAGSAGAAAAGVLSIAILRRRMGLVGKGLQQPLLV